MARARGVVASLETVQKSTCALRSRDLGVVGGEVLFSSFLFGINVGR